MTTAILNSAINLALNIDPQLQSLLPPSNSAKSASKGQQKNSAPAPQVVHRHYHDNSSWWWWSGGGRSCPSSSQPNSSRSSSHRSSEKERKNILTIAVTGLLALTASYFVGREIGTMSDTHWKMRTLEIQEQTLEPNNKPKNVDKVISLMRKIFNDRYERSKIGFLLKGALTTSAVAAGAATLWAAPVIWTASLLGLGTSTAALLVRQGYIDADTTEKEDAYALLNMAQQIKA